MSDIPTPMGQHPGPPDTAMITLAMQLSGLGIQAINAAHAAATASQALIPDMSQGPPQEMPTLPVAVREQERAFRFAACAARIDDAIRELKRPSDLPDPSDESEHPSSGRG